MKKYFLYFLILITFVGIFNYTNNVEAAGVCIDINTGPMPFTTKESCEAEGWSWEESIDTDPASSEGSYNLLQPLPCKAGEPSCEDGELKTFDPEGTSKLGEYLNLMINLFIGLCAVTAVVMIVIGGIEYSTSELVSNKEAAKERIQGAILGLMLALCSWLILNTINPDLLNTEIDIGGATLLSDYEVIQNLNNNVINESPDIPFSPVPANNLQGLGIQCNGGGSAALTSTARSFIGKTVYSMGRRNTISGGKLYTDCSAFVSQVYKCVGLSSPGETTSQIFSSGNVTGIGNISADGTMIGGIPLRVGDLLGWKAGDGGVRVGHVLMYIGNGQMINTSGCCGTVIVNVNSSFYKPKLKYIKRI